mgnify:FL=1
MPDTAITSLPSLSDATGSPQVWGPFGEYLVDSAQRTVLFWDVLRQRSAQYYAHKAMEVPHVLSFDAELILDARTFERPANYLLVRIVPPEGIEIDPRKRPFFVVDPRAGHGPGIGGFKADSELGVAMRAGHPGYFVGFTPDPVPGQTIEDVMLAEAAFLEKVIELHPEAEGKPCVIGNCQAGWAVMMLAAARPELCGPIIAAGAPLSYWAGTRGGSTMRYSGGLLGGSWLTALISDLGNGKFDGAWLVTNFENMNPANTLWTKQYNVWSKVDTEASRYLGFEKWWGGHVNLNAEEIQWIVDQLFVGNRLATAEIKTSNGVRIDLRNIRSPIVCFCSKGDDITPPQQALGWITDLYETDRDILANGQTIVYAVHDRIGHLGIFVSGGVARKQHSEFATNIDLIDVLPPGLYEAVLTPKDSDTVNPDLASGDWVTRFESRTLDDVRAIIEHNPEDERRLAAVRRLSEINLRLYRTFLQPYVQAFANESTAEWLRKLQPAEVPYEFFSEKNPLMQPLAELAQEVRSQRKTAAPDNPFVEMQHQVSKQIIAALDGWRDAWNIGVEQSFLAFFGAPAVQAMLGLNSSDEPPRRHPGFEPEEIAFIDKEIASLKARIPEGGDREATIRGLIFVGLAEGLQPDERVFALLNHIRSERASDLTLEGFKQLVRDQYFMLLLDEERALAAIPGMLPKGAASRKELLEVIRRLVLVRGPAEGERAKRLTRIERLFDVTAITAA